MEWLLIIAAVVLCVCAVAWLAQERLIFFPQPVTSTVHLPAEAAALEVMAADGTRLRGWVVKGAVVPGPVVLYFGGNAEEVSWTLSDARWPRGWTIAALNYRGYGASEGAPGEAELIADALAFFDALKQREELDSRRMVVFGRSLGTAIAAHVAAERSVAGAVLVSPYDSLTAIGKRHYPWLPVSLLLRHRFDALPDARRSRTPLLAIVGDSDSIIPSKHSRALFDAWAGPKTWQVVPRADHNSLAASDLFWAWIAHFLAQR